MRAKQKKIVHLQFLDGQFQPITVASAKEGHYVAHNILASVARRSYCSDVLKCDLSPTVARDLEKNLLKMGSQSLGWKRRRRRTLQITSLLLDDKEDYFSGQEECSGEDDDLVKDIGDFIENHEHNLTNILLEEDDNLFDSILGEGNGPSDNSNSEISNSGVCDGVGDIVSKDEDDYTKLLEDLIGSTSPDERTQKSSITDEIPEENLKLDEVILTGKSETWNPIRRSNNRSSEEYDLPNQSYHNECKIPNLNENPTCFSGLDISSDLLDLPDPEEQKEGKSYISSDYLPDSEGQKEGIRDLRSDHLPDPEEKKEGISDLSSDHLPDPEEQKEGLSSDFLPDPEERNEESLLPDILLETDQVQTFPKSDDPIYKNCTLQIPKIHKRESEEELSESLTNLVNKKIFRVLKKKRKIDVKELQTDDLHCTLKYPKIASAEGDDDVSEEENTLSDTEQIPVSLKETTEKFRQVWRDERKLNRAGRSAPYKAPRRSTYTWQFRSEMNRFLEEEEDESSDLESLPEGTKPFQYYKQVILQPSQSHIYDQDVITSLMSRKWEGGNGGKRKRVRGKRKRGKRRRGFEALFSSDSDESRCDSPDSLPESEDRVDSPEVISENGLAPSNEEGQLGCSRISTADQHERQEMSDVPPLLSDSLNVPSLIADSLSMPVFDWS